MGKLSRDPIFQKMGPLVIHLENLFSEAQKHLDFCKIWILEFFINR